MDFRPGKRRLQQFSFSKDQKASQNQTEGSPADNNDEEFEQFLALIDRIQETKKFLKKNDMNCSSAQDELTVKSISPWKPAFQWEDFCRSGCCGKRVLHSPTAINAGSSFEIHKQNIISSNHVKMLSCNEFIGIDLNVEAAPENKDLALLPLF
ncbi:hypothetical protein KI387_042641, partial [Taxus chinensis]